MATDDFAANRKATMEAVARANEPQDEAQTALPASTANEDVEGELLDISNMRSIPASDPESQSQDVTVERKWPSPCGERGAREDAGPKGESETTTGQRALSLEDCVDIDIDTLTFKLEQHSQRLKKDLFEFFVDARCRMKSRSQAELDSERARAETNDKIKQEELDILREELRDCNKSIKRLYGSLSRFADAVACANDNKRVGRAFVRCFQKWRGFASEGKRIKMRMARALRWYNMEYLKRRVMVSWRDWVRTEHRDTAKQRIRNKVDAARTEIEEDYGKKLAKAEEDMESLRRQLANEEKARNRLEEDMKQAFMRGVCALNLEALSVMKRGVPPRGANPFPINFPDKEVKDQASVEPHL